ncbi:MAG TPA: helix-turn-helix domain-containing protein [Xanthobacteraceae bacterium]|nr:helix-turn-helix domain-containing protein [Xanthobacteraceae bacterium]
MAETVTYRSSCPLASALDIVGDKWSLIVLRGFFVGYSRYGDFLKGPESIATNILADRLKSLECAGLIERTSREARAGYRLTRKGADLLPVLQEMARWGFEHIAERWQPPAWFMKAKPKDFYPKSK